MPRHLPAAACFPGPLVARELRNYLDTRVAPRRPLGVVFGGAKVKDKIGVLRSLVAAMHAGDVLCVGGEFSWFCVL